MERAVSEGAPIVKKLRRRKKEVGSVVLERTPTTSNGDHQLPQIESPGENDNYLSSNVSADQDAVPSKLDLSGTLEHLRRWTLKQDHMMNQTAEYQKRMEGMMQSVLQQITDGNVLQQASLPQLMFGSLPTKDVNQGTVETSPLNNDEVETVLSESPAERAQRDDALSSHSGGSERSLGRLHSVFVDALWTIDVRGKSEHEDYRHWHLKRLEEFVENQKFEYFAACFIFLHSIFIGASVEYLASASTEKHPFFVAGNIVFVVIFCFEVLLKAVAEREEFFHGVEWRWNTFDLILITTVFLEIIMGSVSAGKNHKSMKGVLKILEMVRTVRILRIFRVLKFSITLRVIVGKIIASVRSLVWILILFCLMLYVVSVCLTQGCNDFLDGEQHVVGHDHLTGTKKDMHEYFGSVPRSSFTLFASITGGLQWKDAWTVLSQASFFYAGAFLVFQALSIIAVMNLITGIFVDDSIKADADLVLEAEQIERVQQARHLRDMFEHIDDNHSGLLSLSEFMKFAQDPSLKPYLEQINVGCEEAETLFHLLDEDSSGHIKIDEFLSGCLHLRGEATSLDMKTLLYENKRMKHRLFRHVHEMNHFVHFVESTLEPLASMQQKNASPSVFDSEKTRQQQAAFRYKPPVDFINPGPCPLSSTGFRHAQSMETLS